VTDESVVLLHEITAAQGKRVSRRKRRVVFLVHASETFSALEPIAEELRRRPDVFETIFIALPREYGGMGTGSYSGLDVTFEFLDKKGYDPIPLAGASLDDIQLLIRLAPDFVFRQSPWENDIPPAFHNRMLAFTRVCYVPYSPMQIDEPENTYNQEFHNRAELIFCESDYHRELYRKHRKLRTVGVHATGYPRFEKFIGDLDSAEPVWPLDAPADVPKVIWAPHHTVHAGWLGRSTFLTHAATMLEEALRGRLSILLRPHPALRDAMVKQGHMSEADYDDYMRVFGSAGVSGVDTNREYIQSFKASDCMITDGIGFFAEYALTGKPLLQTTRPDNGPLNDWGNWIIAGTDKIPDGATLTRKLDELATGTYVDTTAEIRAERRAGLREGALGATARIVDILEHA